MTRIREEEEAELLVENWFSGCSVGVNWNET